MFCLNSFIAYESNSVPLTFLLFKVNQDFICALYTWFPVVSKIRLDSFIPVSYFMVLMTRHEAQLR